ncbi:MAG: NADP-dependent oxidoreductase [Anaerolineae bacterium]
MQAARVHGYGGPEQVVIEQAPRPEPRAGQALVRIKAVGVNPIDWKLVGGAFKQYMPLAFPWIPGFEAAGIVEAVGPDVTTLVPGQAVYGPIGSSYAEYTVAPVTELYAKPEHISFEQAASVPHGALTAWQAVVEEAEVQPGQHVLVQGGAGGVGLYAVQLAHWKGAHVIATTSAANADFVRSLGAEQVIDYRTTRFEEVVHDVDAVIDTVGGEVETRSLQTIRTGGIFVTMAGMIAPEAGEGRMIRATSSRRADTNKLQPISELLESRKLIPGVGQVFPLSQVRQALELSQTGHGRGRIILVIG